MSHWWEVSEDQPGFSVGIGKMTDSNRSILKELGFVFRTKMEYPEDSVLVCRVSAENLEIAEAGILPAHVLSSCSCVLGYMCE